jgi:hypothetical protein
MRGVDIFRKVIRQQLNLRRAREGELLAVAARAAARNDSLLPRLLVLAAVGDLMFVSIALLLFFPFLQAATAGVVGPAFRRTAADITIAAAFSGHGMGDGFRPHGHRRQRAHRNNHEHHGQRYSNYLSATSSHGNLEIFT